MKQKKKEKINNDKFNFDDEFIIGVSNSASVTRKKENNKPRKITKNKKKNVVKNKEKYIKNKVRKNRLIKIFMIICLFIAAGCFLCLSPMFNIQQIIVENNNVLSTETVESLSRIELYKNIFLTNRIDVVKNVEENSYIDSVKVKRVLPDKIKIIVNERVEKYFIEFAEGKFAIVDENGYVLSITNERKNLFELVGNETSIEDLTKVDGNKVRLCNNDLKKLDLVNEIVNVSKNYDVDTYITKIDTTEKDDMKLILAGEGKIVYLGSCTDLNTRILYMKEIINAEKGKNGEVFINGNLSSDKVFFRESIN